MESRRKTRSSGRAAAQNPIEWAATLKAAAQKWARRNFWWMASRAKAARVVDGSRGVAQNRVDWTSGAKPLRVNSPQRKNAPRVHSIRSRQRKTRPRVHSSVHAEPFCAETVYTRSLFALTSVHAEPFSLRPDESVYTRSDFALTSVHAEPFCAGTRVNQPLEPLLLLAARRT